MLQQLVRQARLRLIRNQLLAQAAHSTSAALAALILLLLLGTQVLDWRWATLLPIAAIGLGLWRTRRRAPSAYVAAQVVDRRLELADTLSTACFFDTEPGRRRCSDTVRQWQHGAAERVAASVDLARAIPYRVPAAVYPLAVLLLVAGSLFALRYGLTRTLDLRPPLASILQQSFGGGETAERAAAKKQGAPRQPAAAEPAGLDTGDQQTAPLDAAPPNALDVTQVPDVDNSQTVQARTDASKGQEGDPMASDESESGSEPSAGASGDNADGNQQGAQQAKDQKPGANQTDQPGENSSLLQKLKDAMKDLMAKMNVQPPAAGTQKQSQSAKSQKQGQQQPGGDKQGGNQGQKQSSGQPSESEEGQPGEESQTAQNSPSKGAGQNAEEQNNKQPGSGIGKQDGDKELKLAEQMAAMGKLNEIIGKRSATLTGEAMVEVQQTSQQLATRYEGRRATHGESGAEIHRDEVPVALHGYVEQYFEQVRKQKK